MIHARDINQLTCNVGTGAIEGFNVSNINIEIWIMISL